MQCIIVIFTVASEEPKSILNLLGLVRKPSTEETSQDNMDHEQPSSIKADMVYKNY